MHLNKINSLDRVRVSHSERQSGRTAPCLASAVSLHCLFAVSMNVYIAKIYCRLNSKVIFVLIKKINQIPARTTHPSKTLLIKRKCFPLFIWASACRLEEDIKYYYTRLMQGFLPRKHLDINIGINAGPVDR